MAADDLILGFLPRQFSADPEDVPNVNSLLNTLWTNITTKMVEKDDDAILEHRSKMPNREIMLPRVLPSDISDYGWVAYLQELLDLNRLKLVVVLDHNKGQFEILTEKAFFDRLDYPPREYLVARFSDSYPLHHPNIAYTWLWIGARLASLFRQGDTDEFPKDSICYRAPMYGNGGIVEIKQ